jgi:P-type Mg2+ transporter
MMKTNTFLNTVYQNFPILEKEGTVSVDGNTNEIKVQTHSIQSSEQSIANQDILCKNAEFVLGFLNSSLQGLTTEDAVKRLQIYGHNEIAKKKKRSIVLQFLSHFKNPLLLVLIACAIISYVVSKDVTDSAIIVCMILLSVILDFVQEYRAEEAAEKLKKRVSTIVTVMRNGARQDIKINEIVPGDLIVLSAGNIVPADARVIGYKDLHIDQSALTGESFPVEKTNDSILIEEVGSIINWNNYLFMGTSVVSGTATAVVIKTGANTEYGSILKKITETRPETEFEKSLGKFSYLIMKVILVLVIFVFLINAIIKTDILTSLLFAVALAVGLTPELLPMIITINLTKGAMKMSDKGVIVKRLNSIQNFGSMDVLCCDKTGTLTQNKVTVIMHVDLDGKDDDKTFLFSYLNSTYQTGIKNALDEAIIHHEEADEKLDINNFFKKDEIPFDFIRRRISVVVKRGRDNLLITKGAPEEMLKVSTHCELNGKTLVLTPKIQIKIKKMSDDLAAKGYRVLGISYRAVREQAAYSVRDESDMTFLGFIAFIDPPKGTAREAIKHLESLGIELKILTGDNQIVTKKICEDLCFEIKGLVLGTELDAMNDDALANVVEKANIFARVSPLQKNRILEAIKKNKHVVGYIGDGINDTPSMRSSDVAISVDNAVDIAKESADLILLQQDLDVLAEGVIEGRKTFGNTMKYIMMGVSSNFGNMLSAAGASLFLPFLPMLSMQILLNNFLYDLSNITIPADNVDEDYIKRPKKIDIGFIKKFMLFFGPLSSVFDFLTFFVLYSIFKANEALFQTGWFVESLCTQTLIIFVIRTRMKPFYKSKPSKFLVFNVVAIILIAVIFPFTPLAHFFKFVPLPLAFLAVVALFVIAYIWMVESLKHWFYKKYAENNDPSS